MPRSQSAEFILAGTSACGAITLTNPVDVVKTRLQLQGELKQKGAVYTGITQAMLRIFRQEGVLGLQRGLFAAYLLQFSNVGCRFGFYGTLKDFFAVKPGHSTAQWLSSMGLGAVSGSAAALVSNPFFLLKSRFQAIGSEDVLHQHVQPSLRSAFREIGRTHGLSGYYQGLSAFVPRVSAATAVQLSTYDMSKDIILQSTQVQEGISTHFGASLLSGLAVTVAMQPFDLIAVRLMNQPQTSEGALYAGPVDCCKKILQHEGASGLFKGITANYARFGPYCARSPLHPEFANWVIFPNWVTPPKLGFQHPDTTNETAIGLPNYDPHPLAPPQLIIWQSRESCLGSLGTPFFPAWSAGQPT
ncbi:Mitochondrial oxaloacetate transport protein (Mitochondrial carrier protein PMT) [Durusdinium trenchii]|uniref:Mitochondrial oxaloacetate transport protein (Mitochondrial carrier protein PMT) n=1 Tax=Durusdinium trenchii TaxID=1381693 RepID=A0ABP0KWY5_9DINO